MSRQSLMVVVTLFVLSFGVVTLVMTGCNMARGAEAIATPRPAEKLPDPPKFQPGPVEFASLEQFETAADHPDANETLGKRQRMLVGKQVVWTGYVAAFATYDKKGVDLYGVDLVGDTSREWRRSRVTVYTLIPVKKGQRVTVTGIVNSVSALGCIVDGLEVRPAPAANIKAGGPITP